MKRNFKIALPILLVFIGFVAMSFTAGNDGIVLRLNVKKGQSFTMNGKITQLMTINAQGMNMSVPQTIETRQSINIDEVNGDQISTSSSIDAFKMTMTQMGMKLTFDSEHPENNSPMLASATGEIDKLIGKKFTTVYSNRGEIIQAEEIASSLNYQAGIIMLFPEDAIQVGSQWTQDTTLNVSNVDMRTTNTYTVSEITKKSITLTMTTTSAADSQSMAMDMNMSGEGTIIISRATGLVTKTTSKTNCSMTVEEQGLKMPMTMTMTAEYTVE